MSVPDVAEKWSAAINRVTIGATSDQGGTRTSTVTVGGSQCIPFINADGDLDMILGCNSSGGHRAFIYYNTGDANVFGSSPESILSATGADYFGTGVAVGDFDGNGEIDVAVGAGLTRVLYVFY